MNHQHVESRLLTLLRQNESGEDKSLRNRRSKVPAQLKVTLQLLMPANAVEAPDDKIQYDTPGTGGHGIDHTETLRDSNSKASPPFPPPSPPSKPPSPDASPRMNEEDVTAKQRTLQAKDAARASQLHGLGAMSTAGIILAWCRYSLYGFRNSIPSTASTSYIHTI